MYNVYTLTPNIYVKVYNFIMWVWNLHFGNVQRLNSRIGCRLSFPCPNSSLQRQQDVNSNFDGVHRKNQETFPERSIMAPEQWKLLRIFSELASNDPLGIFGAGRVIMGQKLTLPPPLATSWHHFRCDLEVTSYGSDTLALTQAPGFNHRVWVNDVTLGSHQKWCYSVGLMPILPSISPRFFLFYSPV